MRCICADRAEWESEAAVFLSVGEHRSPRRRLLCSNWDSVTVAMLTVCSQAHTATYRTVAKMSEEILKNMTVPRFYSFYSSDKPLTFDLPTEFLRWMRLDLFGSLCFLTIRLFIFFSNVLIWCEVQLDLHSNSCCWNFGTCWRLNLCLKKNLHLRECESFSFLWQHGLCVVFMTMNFQSELCRLNWEKQQRVSTCEGFLKFTLIPWILRTFFVTSCWNRSLCVLVPRSLRFICPPAAEAVSCCSERLNRFLKG